MSVHPDVGMSGLNQHPPFTCPLSSFPPEEGCMQLFYGNHKLLGTAMAAQR